MRAKRPSRASFFDRTGEEWPARLHGLRSRDARLKDYLEHLAATEARDEPELLLWVLCAGIWWLEPHEAREVAALLRECLESRPNW